MSKLIHQLKLIPVIRKNIGIIRLWQSKKLFKNMFFLLLFITFAKLMIFNLLVDTNTKDKKLPSNNGSQLLQIKQDC